VRYKIKKREILKDSYRIRSHIDNAVLILEGAIDAEELSARHRDAVPFIQLWIDDGVRDARFVFEAKEDEALGCTGTLSSDHRSCDTGIRSVRHPAQACGRQHTSGIHLCPVICHRVRAKRDPRTVKISNQPLFSCHGPQRSGCLHFMLIPDMLEERAGRLSCPLRFP
jgi:hypothetical protein